MVIDNLKKFDWISEFVSILPKIEYERKDFISIAGYPSWENVNSNLLAFYFDENEEHKFYGLFINSLLDIYYEKTNTKIPRETFEGDFSVEREVQTDSNKRIDILINESSTPTEWSIIIENKIYAALYNDLEDYWDSVDSKNKIGIVLSINPVDINNTDFINILHRELLNKVIQNLPNYYEQSDDRHLLLLKEYVLNINTHYRNTKEMDETLKIFQSKREDIETIIKLDARLHEFVSKTVSKIMTANEYKASSNRVSSKGKHFYHKEKGAFRFWVNLDKIKKENNFIAYFELWGKENTTHGNTLKQNLQQQIDSLNLPRHIEIVTGGNSGSGFQHIYRINIPIGEFSTEGFKERIKKILEEYIFKETFINVAVSEYNNITLHAP